MQASLGRRTDKRRVTRNRVALPASYTSNNISLEGQVTDVSPEGMFFCSDYLDEQGEIATVMVSLPTRREPLRLRGEVRWVSDAPHGGGMGIRLVGVSLQDRLALSAAADPYHDAPQGNA